MSLAQAGGVVIAGQVRCDRVVAPPAQRLFDEVPGPADVTGTVDEHGRRHRLDLLLPGLHERTAEQDLGAASAASTAAIMPAAVWVAVTVQARAVLAA
ncbi:MAG TPA: hypothetical protein VF082_05125 [Jiangellaceae bacterium]